MNHAMMTSAHFLTIFGKKLDGRLPPKLAFFWNNNHVNVMFDYYLLALLPFILLPFGNPLSCYSCQFSFNDVYDIDNHNAWCTNSSLLKHDKNEVIKPCATWETWCIVQLSMRRYSSWFTESISDCHHDHPQLIYQCLESLLGSVFDPLRVDRLWPGSSDVCGLLSTG